ncbi:carboxy terminal-processing peptidase [Gilliamella sp. B2776]|uniref:carboxy terminal-processing peptidase n=1 Tax=unclassified Gilliamella TaxID=2685620 RepID=UPI00226986ED|nr:MULTISPECIES: carboxy terminal-processing peptidase [unclassified Gilliamella]MCX8649380.1 carboxy terminal-processing peptidase [Gilliamella sp. B2779]MCX8654759.1 carboxy terminal-processing peptidase [Gilliamella sp. B2737]MCX8655779.1 carboxy terminal-processing peptidase [Gilliamella sp. B2894]MCX8663882.1 carboxy terminal-processing peptidase [Gilliamella sp. B2887]MCX8691125.1 carboxy terminal-processing peptidase [Gilliamella sp. B2776]
MNKLLKGTIKLSLALCIVSLSVQAKQPVAEQLPILKQDDVHQVVAKRVTNFFTQAHYRNFALDGAFSAKIFDRYFKMLDGSKAIFIQDDIDTFRNRQELLGQELFDGNLKTAYDIYNLAMRKRYERYKYALKVLQSPMDFSTNDEIDFNREDISWAITEKELDSYWNKRVKYDELSLSLSGKTETQIREILTKRYNRVLKTIEQSNNEDAFQVFMNAFAREIDPHTSYLAPRKKRDFDSEMSLSFEGIGATLSQQDDYTVIMSFVTGGPAEKSKSIAVGDKIIGVGQSNSPIEDVIGWRLDDIVDKIRGPKGTVVKLEILPAGNNSKPKIIELTRDKIHFEDREAKLNIVDNPRGKVGIIDIPSFYMGLTDKVESLLLDANKAKLQGLVIDLRNNGGGSLAEVISLTGLFIDYGPVVQVRDNLQKVIVYDDKNKGIEYTGPIVVMVNRYSASASEIFAAALQDYGRAVIVGETTYGKGTVQTSRNIAYQTDARLHPNWPELGGVQYTVQKFYRINGGSTQLKGVEPDIEMGKTKYDDETGERFLDNAMPWDKIPSSEYLTLTNIKPILPYLKSEHLTRISNNPEFVYIDQDIQELNDKKERRYIVSLNKKNREAEQKSYEDRDLKRTNERLAREGKPPISKLEDLPKDYKQPDAYLNESVEILLDLAPKYPNIEVKKSTQEVISLSSPINK